MDLLKAKYEKVLNEKKQLEDYMQIIEVENEDLVNQCKQILNQVKQLE